MSLLAVAAECVRLCRLSVIQTTKIRLAAVALLYVRLDRLVAVERHSDFG